MLATRSLLILLYKVRYLSLQQQSGFLTANKREKSGSGNQVQPPGKTCPAPPPHGVLILTFPYSPQAFKTGDGHFLVGAGNDGLFRKLCQVR